MANRQRNRGLNDRPKSFITTHRNRLKVYQQENIYMSDGTEFELELDNRTNQTWLAKIKLNGEWTDDSGLVLRPGEHFYLDTPNLTGNNRKRFKFETYNVPKGRGDLIADNGLVEVFFYCKELPQPPITWSYYPDVWRDDFGKRTGDNPHIYYSGTTTEWTNDNATLTSGISNVNLSGEIQMSNNCSVGNFSAPQRNIEETGRIEAGSQSNQNFAEVDINFNSYHSYSDVYHILPLSKKHTQTHEIKNYCNECGRRRRKNDKFCPSCGSRF